MGTIGGPKEGTGSMLYLVQTEIPFPPPLCMSYGFVKATADVRTLLIWDLV